MLRRVECRIKIKSSSTQITVVFVRPTSFPSMPIPLYPFDEVDAAVNSITIQYLTNLLIKSTIRRIVIGACDVLFTCKAHNQLYPFRRIG